MALMPEDVLNKNFTATQFRRGYDEHEVDDFLDEIVAELRRLSSENNDLDVKLRTCLENLKVCQEDKGVIAPDAQDKISLARVSAEQAEQEAAARIARANEDAELAEAEAAERTRVAQEAAQEAAQVAAEATAGSSSAAAVTNDPPVQEEAPVAASVGLAGGADLGSAAGVLALAQKLHEEYVTDGQNTRERLISEGQLQHDQVVGEATAKQEELLSTGQAKYDELVAEASEHHEQMISEARERSTGMLAEAQQKSSEMLEGLSRERDLLTKKIDELRIFERDYRARLKAHLEDQLTELERTGAEPPAEGEDEGVGAGPNDEGEQPKQGGKRHDD